MNTRYLDFHLVAGTQDPVSITGIRGPGEIPAAAAIRSRVVAAFNAGFKTVSGHYGVMVNRVVYLPALNGIATFAMYQNHSVRLGAWGSGITMTPGLVSLRQNLPLLISNHQINPQIGNMQYWGFTVNNAVHVWRSALGITANGNLIYVGGPNLTAQTLAAALQTAHVVNAMELDINSYWVTYNLYQWKSGRLLGTKLMPAMTRPGDRYLTPDTRDFFYVTLAQHPR